MWQIILRILLVILLATYIFVWKNLSCLFFGLFFIIVLCSIYYEVFTYLSASKFALLDGLFKQESSIKRFLSGKYFIAFESFLISFTLTLILLLGLSGADNIIFFMSVFGIFIFIAIKKVFNKTTKKEFTYGYLYTKKLTFLFFSVIMVILYAILYSYFFTPLPIDSSFLEHIRTVTYNPEVKCIVLKDLYVGFLYIDNIKIWLFSSFFNADISFSLLVTVVASILFCISAFSYFFAISHIYSFLLNADMKNIPKKLKPGLFVITILLLALISVSLYIGGFIKNQNIGAPNTSHTEEIFRFVFGSEHIEVQKSDILTIISKLKENKSTLLQDANKSIDILVDEIFDTSTPKITKEMSEWYFSILTDYALLLSWATEGSVDEIVLEKFNTIFSNNFPDDIDDKYLKIKAKLDESFSISTLNTIQKYDVNKNIKDNNLLLNNEISTIFQNSFNNSAKRLTYSAGITTASLGIMGTLGAKSSIKLAGKIAAKTAVKSGASLAGGGVGLACGPFAVICSPLLAIGTWISVDYAITKLDESFNKDEFERDIVESLNVGRDRLKKDMYKAIEDYYIEVENTLLKRLDS